MGERGAILEATVIEKASCYWQDSTHIVTSEYTMYTVYCIVWRILKVCTESVIYLFWGGLVDANGKSSFIFAKILMFGRYQRKFSKTKIFAVTKFRHISYNRQTFHDIFRKISFFKKWKRLFVSTLILMYKRHLTT